MDPGRNNALLSFPDNIAVSLSLVIKVMPDAFYSIYPKPAEIKRFWCTFYANELASGFVCVCACVCGVCVCQRGCRVNDTMTILIKTLLYSYK